MKKVHIATVGVQSGGVFSGLLNYGADVLYLLHSEREDVVTNAQSIKRKVEQIGCTCHLKLIDIYDVQTVIETVLDISKAHPKDIIYVNISGGLSYIAAAAQIGAYLIGAKVYFMRYWEKEEGESVTDKVIELPLPKIRPTELKGTRRRVLGYIEKNPGCNNKEIADAFEISAQMGSIHVLNLINDELVREEIEGKEKKLFITNSGKLLVIIIKPN